MTDDAAFARGLARRGWRVVFHDGGGLIDVDMHDERRRRCGASGAARSRSRTSRRRPLLAADVALVWLVLALPVLRTAAGPPPSARPRAARRPDRARLSALAPSYATAGRRRSGSRRSRTPPPRCASGWSALRPPRAVARTGLRRREDQRADEGHQPTRAHHVLDRIRRQLARAGTRTPRWQRAPGGGERVREGARSRRTPPGAPRAAAGDSANAPPTKVITALPPRKPVQTGNACPTIAPATAAYPVHQSPRARAPDQARRSGAWRRRRRTPARRARRRAARARSRRPGCRRPCGNRSTPYERATGSDTGIAPSR